MGWRAGDIGEPVRHIEFEPFPESVPQAEPTVAPAVPTEAPEPVVVPA